MTRTVWTGWVICILTLVALSGVVGGAPATATSHVSCEASPLNVEPGERVVLDASATEADVIDFDIDGDGTYDQRDSDDFIIEVTYEDPGTYEPVARADEDSDSTASCGVVSVGDQNPTASLDVSPNPAKEGDTVTLDASMSSDSDGTIVEYRWDLDGDGEIDEVTEVDTIEQEYPAGEYTPTVTVVDDDELTDSDSESLTVESNDPPSADFSIDPNPGKVGETVEFDASTSSDSDGNIVEYRWDFDGDGTIEQTTTSSTTTTSYDSAGSYTPAVTVVDDDGATDTTSTDYVVEDTKSPAADLSLDPNPAGVSESVEFDASASSDSDGDIVEYRWDFDGDGNIDQTTDTATTTTSYGVAGEYVPSVTVVDNDGLTDSDSTSLIVGTNDPPTADLEVNPDPGKVGERVEFDASASSDADGEIAEYRWDFDGDGTVEETTTPRRRSIRTTRWATTSRR